MSLTPGAAPSLQDLLAKLAPLLKAVGSRGGPQGPGTSPGTPAQIGQVAQPNQGGAGLTPVLSTPQAVGVAPNPPAAQSNPAVQGGWFPNKRAASGAVATSAIDSIAQAITGFKQKRDSDNIAKAQNSLNMFLNAMEKGDMQVANLLAKDPKIIKSWEKYLKMEFPRVEGGTPGKPGGVNEPGGIAATQDTTAQLMQALQVANEQQKLATGQAQEAELRGSANAYNNEADVYAANAKAIPVKTAAEAEEAHANTVHSIAAANLADAQTAVENINKADLHAQNEANIKLLNAQAAYQYSHAKYEETIAGLGGLTPAEQGKMITTDLTNLRAQAQQYQQRVLELQKGMQSPASIGKILGVGQTSVTDDMNELQKAQTALDGLNKTIRTYSTLSDSIMKGKLNRSDALQQAFTAGGLDTTIQLPTGPGADLFKGHENDVYTAPDGSRWSLENGDVVMVGPATRGMKQ